MKTCIFELVIIQTPHITGCSENSSGFFPAHGGLAQARRQLGEAVAYSSRTYLNGEGPAPPRGDW